MRQICLCVFACVLHALSLGCSGNTAHSTTIPAPSVDSCSAGWQPITVPRDEATARSLDYRDGELYYFSITDYTVRIEAQPVAGGAPRIVAQSISAGEMWITGDQLYYAFLAELWRVPVTGGTPVQLISPTYSAPEDLQVGFETLSPTALYWQRAFGEIWSAPLDGSSPGALFAKMGDIYPLALGIFGNELIVGGSKSNIGVTGMVFPLDGSAPRTLARAGYGIEYLGMDEQGVYGYDYASETQAVLHVAPADGGPAQPFWPGIPRLFLPLKLWPDGSGGGYLVAGDEVFDDGMSHKSLFVVDSQGNATRVACDASREGALDSIEARPAFADDAIYLYNVDMSGALDADASTPPEMWQIIKIPRP